MNTIKLNTIGTPFPKAEGGDTPSGDGSGSVLKYYDAVDSDSMTKSLLLTVASIVKLYNNGWVIAPAGVSLELGLEAVNKVTAFGVDWTMEVMLFGEKQTTKQFFEAAGITIDSLTEITKEEFYNIEA